MAKILLDEAIQIQLRRMHARCVANGTNNGACRGKILRQSSQGHGLCEGHAEATKFGPLNLCGPAWKVERRES